MISFKLVSSDGSKFDGEVYEILVPTPNGTIAVFEDHMPIISAASPGVLSIRRKSGDSDKSMEHFAIAGGVIQVDGKTVRFISDEITSSEDVSEKEAQEAHKKAEELVASASNLVAIDEAKRVLQHRTAQLHVARLKKRHHQ
jgi:F-type H+-transporting ATPase subunit epsilon